MVSEETLQAYADKIFGEVDGPIAPPRALRNLNNGKFLLEQGDERIELDEHALNSDMESAVRAFRERLFPKPPEPVEPAAAAEPEAPAPEPEPEAAPIADTEPPTAPVSEVEPAPEP